MISSVCHRSRVALTDISDSIFTMHDGSAIQNGAWAVDKDLCVLMVRTGKMDTAMTRSNCMHTTVLLIISRDLWSSH